MRLILGRGPFCARPIIHARRAGLIFGVWDSGLFRILSNRKGVRGSTVPKGQVAVIVLLYVTGVSEEV